MNLTYTVTDPKTSQSKMEISSERIEEIVRNIKNIDSLLAYFCPLIAEISSCRAAVYSTTRLAKTSGLLKKEAHEFFCLVRADIRNSYPHLGLSFENNAEESMQEFPSIRRRLKPYILYRGVAANKRGRKRWELKQIQTSYDKWQAVRNDAWRDISVHLPLINCLVNNICVDIFTTYFPDIVGSKSNKSLSMKALQVRDLMQELLKLTEREARKTYPKEEFISEYTRIYPRHMMVCSQIATTQPAAPAREVNHG